MSWKSPGEGANDNKEKVSVFQSHRMKRYGIPLGIIAIAGLIAIALISTAPKSKRKIRERNALLVEIVKVKLSTERARIEAMGLVQPADMVELRPRVSGEIVSLNPDFLPGGIIQQGEPLLNIDRTDYRLSIRQIQSSVAQAEANYRLELANHAVAQREYEVSGTEISQEDEELVLRRPQLEAAKAALDAAKANLEEAQLKLRRTAVPAPFNAVVISRDVNVGSQVSESSTLGQLAGSDRYWVVASVPVDELKWINVAPDDYQKSSAAQIYDEAAWGESVFRSGYVLGISADLEDGGRMAKVLIAVPDPLSLLPENSGKPTLLLNSYVRAVIEGPDVESAAILDRSLIRDGDKIWLIDDENRLRIRKVDIAFSGPDRVFVRSGIIEGEKIISSYLTAPVEGMLLRTEEDIDKLPAPASGVENKSRK